MDGDGFRQSLQLLLIEVLTGLILVGLYFINRQQLVGAVFRDFLGEIPQQRTQATAQALVRCP